MAQNIPTDVEDTMKSLKSKPGFHAYIIMNNDGIVIKYENMEYGAAVRYAYHVLNLYAKAKKHIATLTDGPENEVECLRLRTNLYEMIIAQYSRFTLVVLQLPCCEGKEEAEKVEEPIKEEGDQKAAE